MLDIETEYFKDYATVHAVISRLMGQPDEDGATNANIDTLRGTIAGFRYEWLLTPPLDTRTQQINWQLPTGLTHQNVTEIAAPALKLGERYLNAFMAANDIVRLRMVEFSERFMHIPHSCAVWWLEQNPSDTQAQAAGYLTELQRLWLNEVAAIHRCNSPNFATLANYLRAHTLLGKTTRSRRTDAYHFHKMICLHPAYWGLFQFSPTVRQDKGDFDVATDQAFTAFRTNFVPEKDDALPKQNPKTSTRYPTYDIVPRLFSGENATADGVYLHRSTAHGRDDFLIAKKSDQLLLVLCNKGAGFDYDRLAGSVAKDWQTDGLDEQWESPSTPTLPFAHKTSDNYATLGYSVESPTDEDGIHNTFYGFLAVYEQARLLSARNKNTQDNDTKQLLDALTRPFVEPYSCIELSTLSNARLRTGIAESGQPVQIIYGRPFETSLRLQVNETDRKTNYRYGVQMQGTVTTLELREWQRCFDGFPISKQLMAEIDSKFSTDGTQAKEKAELAHQIAIAVLASVIVFLSKNWAAGPGLNNGFSKRNFGSGPRDSDDWGPPDVTNKLELLSSNARDTIQLLPNYFGFKITKDKNDDGVLGQVCSKMLIWKSGAAKPTADDFLSGMQQLWKDSYPPIANLAEVALDARKTR